MATGGGGISSTSEESDEEEESDDSDDDYEDADGLEEVCCSSSDGRETVISLDNQSIVTLIDKKEAEDSPEHRFCNPSLKCNYSVTQIYPKGCVNSVYCFPFLLRFHATSEG